MLYFQIPESSFNQPILIENIIFPCIIISLSVISNMILWSITSFTKIVNKSLYKIHLNLVNTIIIITFMLIMTNLLLLFLKKIGSMIFLLSFLLIITIFMIIVLLCRRTYIEKMYLMSLFALITGIFYSLFFFLKNEIMLLMIFIAFSLGISLFKTLEKKYIRII